ncbi:MAG: sirohydrochlorin chelatase [Thermodesulfobacteriota bacterium]
MSQIKRALILIDHGSTVAEANNLLVGIKDKLTTYPGSDFDIIEYCHMELSPPTLEDAFKNCVESGADEIVVHPYFLAPGRHSKTDIPNMVNSIAVNYPDIKCKISEPLGLHDKIIEVIIDRANSS